MAAAAAAYCPDLHKDSFHPACFAGLPPRPSSHARLAARRELLAGVTALVKALLDTAKTYKDNEEKEGAAAVAAHGRAVERCAAALHTVARCMTAVSPLRLHAALHRAAPLAPAHDCPTRPGAAARPARCATCPGAWR
jgi:hypothetical protein